MRNVPLTLATIFSEWRDPDIIIAWRDDKCFRLTEFKLDVLHLIEQLNTFSVERCALYFEDSYFFTVALIATLYSGKTPVLLGHLRHKQLQEYEYAFDVVITDMTITAHKTIVDIRMPRVRELTTLPLWQKGRSLTLFTSGSTGSPKAINKSIDLLEREAHLLMTALLRNQSTNRLITTVSHQHLYGLTFNILLPLLAGIAFEAKSIQYHEQLYAYPAALLVSSPAFLKRLDIHLPNQYFPLVLSAGGPLSYAEANLVKQCLGVLPQEIYGSSETGVIATRQQQQIDQPWQVFPEIVIESNDNSISINSPLCEVSPVRLEDRIEAVVNGFLLLGRQDRVVKIEENRVSLVDVETRLKTLPEIADAAILVLQQRNGVVLGAGIVLTAIGQQQLLRLGKQAMLSQLRQQFKDVIEPVAIPKKWRVLKELPYNTQGKIFYRELEVLFK